MTIANSIIGLGIMIWLLPPYAHAAAGCKVGPESNECLPVVPTEVPFPQAEVDRPPDLYRLRGYRHSPHSMPTPHPSKASSLPTPGGLDASIIYLPNQLQATTSAALETQMIVRVFGLAQTTTNPVWTFTTSTNRTPLGVEFVGIYHQQDPYGSLGVFDWSCSATNPCYYNGAYYPDPSWVWTSQLSNFACNINFQGDRTGHKIKLVTYYNSTTQTGTAPDGTPIWQNTVLLYNYCQHQFDQIWTHEYTAVQQDCSASQYTCSWWGPTLEIYWSTDSPIPAVSNIRVLGFFNTTLIHDGIISHLLPSETTFDKPSLPWQLLYLNANDSFEAGDSF